MPRPSRGGASYRAVLALPHARSLFAAAMLARLSYGLVGLPLLLTLKQATGSYTVAGTAAGLFGLLAAVLGPVRARLVERRPRALMPLAGVYAGLLAGIAAAGAAGAAPWLAVTLAAAAGIAPPPVGPLMRTLWGRLAADQDQRQAALSLDTVSESTVFVLGPALAGILIGAGSPPSALAFCAALVLVGFSALTSALRRSPTRLRPAAEARTVRSSWGPLRTAGFAAMLLVVLTSGCAIAVEEIAAIAVWGPGVTGSLLALCSVGGVLGGLAYGRRTWRASLARRLTLISAAGAACFALPSVATFVPVAAVALLCAGAFQDTTLITSYLLVDSMAAANAQTEAGAWVNTAYNLGVAAGSAVAGVVLDRAGAGMVFALAAGTAGAGTLMAVVCGRGIIRTAGVLPQQAQASRASAVRDMSE